MDESTKNKFLGFILIIVGLITFILFTLWMIIAKAINIQTDSDLVNFLKNDKEYCFAIPLVLPITIFFSYIRWSAFSYFKHC
jgi:hypothetical protein